MSACVNRPFAFTIKNAFSMSYTRLSSVERQEQEAYPALAKTLGQVHKLARNYVVSLDLGITPGFRMVNEVDQGVKTVGLSGKDKYLLWVKNWKLFYKELSLLIREVKKCRGPVFGYEEDIRQLKETAQIMLNARHVAKLASWSIKQRDKRLNTK